MASMTTPTYNVNLDSAIVLQSLTGYPKKELQKEEEITGEKNFTREYYLLYFPYAFYKNCPGH